MFLNGFFSELAKLRKALFSMNKKCILRFGDKTELTIRCEKERERRRPILCKSSFRNWRGIQNAWGYASRGSTSFVRVASRESVMFIAIIQINTPAGRTREPRRAFAICREKRTRDEENETHYAIGALFSRLFWDSNYSSSDFR